MTKIAVLIKFKARPGTRDALTDHLVKAGESYTQEVGTEAFVVGTSPDDPDEVIVYERYLDAAAKAAHESEPGYAEIRQKTGSFLIGPPLTIPIVVIGGKL